MTHVWVFVKLKIKKVLGNKKLPPRITREAAENSGGEAGFFLFLDRAESHNYRLAKTLQWLLLAYSPTDQNRAFPGACHTVLLRQRVQLWKTI